MPSAQQGSPREPVRARMPQSAAQQAQQAQQPSPSPAPAAEPSATTASSEAPVSGENGAGSGNDNLRPGATQKPAPGQPVAPPGRQSTLSRMMAEQQRQQQLRASKRFPGSADAADPPAVFPAFGKGIGSVAAQGKRSPFADAGRKASPTNNGSSGSAPMQDSKSPTAAGSAGEQRMASTPRRAANQAPPAGTRPAPMTLSDLHAFAERSGKDFETLLADAKAKGVQFADE